MIPLHGYAGLAIGMHSIPIPVQDVQYTVVGGMDRQAKLQPREIQGVVDASGGKELQMIFGGSMSVGDIGIYTQSDLFIADEHTEQDQRLQSFVTYGGKSYRIKVSKDWKIQAGMSVYLGERHATQDLV